MDDDQRADETKRSMPTAGVSRRRFVGAISGAALATLAGCSGDGSGGNGNESAGNGNNASTPAGTKKPEAQSKLFESVEVTSGEGNSKRSDDRMYIVARVNTDAVAYNEAKTVKWVDAKGTKHSQSSSSYFSEKRLDFGMDIGYAAGTQKIRAYDGEGDVVTEVSFEYAPSLKIVEMVPFADASTKPDLEAVAELDEKAAAILVVKNTGSGFAGLIEPKPIGSSPSVLETTGFGAVAAIGERMELGSTKLLRAGETTRLVTPPIGVTEKGKLTCGSERTVEGEMTLDYVQGTTTTPLSVTFGGEKRALNEGGFYACSDASFDVGNQS